jgi:predicted alpha/beta hydrolase
MPKILNVESMPVALSAAEHLHITRFYHDQEKLAAPVFMLASVAQDGSTFFTDEGKGLACYLARQGYDVYVADLRGKGKSWPHINASSSFGSHQAIMEEIPQLLAKIVAKRGNVPQVWIGHGWGSVLLCSFYARFGDQYCPVEKMVHFAARRKILHSNSRKKTAIKVVWQKVARWIIALRGFLPGRLLRLGSSHESKASFQDYLGWANSCRWVDRADGFDYGAAIQQQTLPPSYYFAAEGDRVYGDPGDVREFVRELGQHDGRLMVLSRKGGNLQDYGHLAIVQHRDCENDHFPILLRWLLAA